MKRIYLFVIAVIFSINTNAQTPGWLWANGIGDAGSDAGNSIAIDNDGNIYTTGSFVSTVDFDPGAGVFNLTSFDPTTLDIFITKTDSNGNFIWAKSMGGGDVDVSRAVAFDPSGSGAVYISGNFKGTVDFDPNAGVFNLISATPAYSDAFICKLDTSGNLLWAKGMGGSEDDVANSFTIDNSGSGDVYCTGFFRQTADFDPDAGIFNLTSAGFNDIFVSKYNSSGNFIWAKSIGGMTYEVGSCIATCPTGCTDVYIIGYFAASVDFDPGAGITNLSSAGLDDVFIAKLDSAGNFVWAKALGGQNPDFGVSITADNAGNVYTTGRFQVVADFDPGAGLYNLTSVGGDDVFVSKLDASGNFVWAKGFGSGTYDIGNSIVLDFDGNIYTTGSFNLTVDFDPGAGVSNLISTGNSDIFISSLDNSGNFNWAKQAGGLNGDNGRALVLDGSDQLILTGSFSSTTISFDSTTLQNGGQSDIFVAKLDSVFTSGVETISNNQFPVYIYPNPFTDELTVNCSKPGDLKIYDLCGRIVYTETLTSFSTKRITANWQKGIYFVEVITDEGIVMKKVVKH